MSEEKKGQPDQDTEAQEDGALAESDMEKVAGGVAVGTFAVRGQTEAAALAKIGDDTGTISEFVPTKLTLG